MSKKIAFITGINGMDGSHLTEQLLEKGYRVYGLLRRSSTDGTWRLKKVINNIEIVTGDMVDKGSLDKALQFMNPDEIYNLAAMSFVRESWNSPEYTFNVNAAGLIRLLESARIHCRKDVKIYQASSSEQFGKVRQSPQTENTPFYPRSVYGVSKVAAYWIAVNYRESYNMFISNGICFNHESYRRGLEFLSRKVTYGVTQIKLGLKTHIELGNLDSKRDFGWAQEYTEAMYKILQLSIPDDFVLATGETHSVKEFVIEAFRLIGIEDWKSYIKTNPKYMRPAEVDYLQGDSKKAESAIDWEPKVKFKELVKIMVEADIERLERGDKFA